MVVYGLVRQMIGPAVLFPPNVSNGVGGKFSKFLHDFEIKRLQVDILYLISTKDLPDDKFRIQVNSQVSATKTADAGKAVQQGTVFGFVIGALPQVFPAAVNFMALFINNRNPGASITGIASGGPVRKKRQGLSCYITGPAILAVITCLDPGIGRGGRYFCRKFERLSRLQQSCPHLLRKEVWYTVFEGAVRKIPGKTMQQFSCSAVFVRTSSAAAHSSVLSG